MCVCSRVPHISVLREVHLQNLCAHLKRCEQNKTAADTHTHTHVIMYIARKVGCKLPIYRMSVCVHVFLYVATCMHTCVNMCVCDVCMPVPTYGSIYIYKINK